MFKYTESPITLRWRRNNPKYGSLHYNIKPFISVKLVELFSWFPSSYVWQLMMKNYELLKQNYVGL